MKYPQEQIDIMLSAFEQIMESYGYSAAEIRDNYKDTPMKPGWRLASIAHYDLSYDDSHPAYSRTVNPDG